MFNKAAVEQLTIACITLRSLLKLLFQFEQASYHSMHYVEKPVQTEIEVFIFFTTCSLWCAIYFLYIVVKELSYCNL